MTRGNQLPRQGITMNYTANRALLLDYYELTMAQGYHALGLQDKVATFNLFFREIPFNGGYAIVGGIAPALEYLQHVQFTSDDIEYLKGQGLFTGEFLDYLSSFKFSGSVDGLPEGTVAFPHEPLLQVTAPIIEAQLVESALLNIVNYSTLIATKTSRICYAAREAKVVEFGLRRAQGDGAFLGTRAAMIGGAVSTSFVHAGKILDAPVTGTQAHSWIQVFDSELEAFRAYAKVFPAKCLLLIDTYNVLNSGLGNAIQVAKELHAEGNELLGVRIDSGDLAYLAVEVYRKFKEEGFPNITIVLSNDLDETLIETITLQIVAPGNNFTEDELQLRKDVVAHLMHGVGTKLITGGSQASLGGVYKLVAVDGEPRIKLSENSTKIIDPGIKQVYRVMDPAQETFLADVIALHDEGEPVPGSWIYHPAEERKKYKLETAIVSTPLMIPFIENGCIVLDQEALDWKKARDRCAADLTMLHPTYKRLINPHEYKVSLSEKLHALKQELIDKYA
ncbi:MAG TPA: nicotinate phosphoribosyltransferase [Candidatus Lokiarchaeia archaeon]|nr:nicotinate phosphoribosyltransferase [Candidatus Lokiarchaeia archaeon]